MKIGFYGAGKVGVSLGLYFKSKGLDLSGYYSRTIASKVYGAEVTKSRVFNTIEDLVNQSDVIFLTVSDNAVWECLESISDLNIWDKIIINTSGSLSSSYSKKSNGGYFYSLHPIYPFSDKETSYKELNNAIFCLEGDEEKLNLVKTLIESLGNKVVLINGEKGKYHLACTIASNLQLALTKIACEYLQEVGFSEEEARESLYPLMKQNIENIRDKGFEEGITGPIVRGDTLTIKSHLKFLKEEHKELYGTLSRELLEISKRKNGELDIYNDIQKVLGGNEDEEFNN